MQPIKASWLVSYFGTQSKLARAMGTTTPTVNRHHRQDLFAPKEWIGALYMTDRGKEALEAHEAESKAVTNG